MPPRKPGAASTFSKVSKKDPGIRQEAPEDHTAVEAVIELAFRDEEISDHSEHHLVARLRHSEAFVPELSLVAEIDGTIIGHILLTKIKVRKGDAVNGSLALAPVTVHPNRQGQGIGRRLIERAHEVARSLGFKSVILLGHAAYYPRFGYRPTVEFGIQLPFEVPPENCLALELVPDGLKGVEGMVEYPKEFSE